MTDNRVYYPQRTILPINQGSSGTAKNNAVNKTVGINFNELLTQKTAEVKFSQHALQRLESRNIKLNQSEMLKLGNAVEKAAQKGAKESLILMNNNLALVVSIKNRTVITAMDGASLRDNVFTNIDSAVIV